MSSWAKARFERYKERASSTPIQLDDYDQEILDSTKRLCNEFQIPQMKYNPYRVDWEEEISLPVGRTGSAAYPVAMADFCTQDPSLIILEKSAKARLEPKDWMPLIASELAYRYIVKPKGRWNLVKHIILPVGTVFVILTALTYSIAFPLIQGLGGLGEVLSEVLFIPIFLVAVLVIALLSRPIEMRERFEADRLAAQKVGKDAMLSTLSKADAILRVEVATARDKRVYRWGRIPEQKRIEALTGSSLGL